MRYELCNFAYLWKRGKMGCFERQILAVCWWLTAHFCNNMSKNAFCFVFVQGAFCIATAPLQLFLKEFLWLSHSFFHCWLLVFDFFRQKNKRTYLSLANTLMKFMYLCLILFLLWTLALLYVMLNLFQHLTASLYLLPLLGEILN